MEDKPTVVVIDDDLHITEALSLRLTMAGCNVRTADNGYAGLALISECNPDAVVLDLSMPQMDGITVLTSLNDSGLNEVIPVVVLTARVSDKVKRRVMELGAYGFIQKPYDAEYLVTTLQSAISRGHQDMSPMSFTARG